MVRVVWCSLCLLGYTLVASAVAENAVQAAHAVNDTEGGAGNTTDNTADPVAAFHDCSIAPTERGHY